MKSFLEDYSRIIGFLLLVFVIIIVFSTPFMILARTITMFEVQKEDPILLTVFSFIYCTTRNSMILIIPCETLIAYIEPVFSRTIENTKPTEKASTQSKCHGHMFPR